MVLTCNNQDCPEMGSWSTLGNCPQCGELLEPFDSNIKIKALEQQIKELKEYPIYHKKECDLVDGMLSKNAHQRMVAHCTCGLDKALKDK